MVINNCVNCLQPSEIKDPGNNGVISPSLTNFVRIVTKGEGEMRKLSPPAFPGQLLFLSFQDDRGDCSVQCPGSIDENGHTRIKFTAVSQTVGLVAGCAGSAKMPFLVWQLAFNTGAELLPQ